MRIFWKKAVKSSMASDGFLHLSQRHGKNCVSTMTKKKEKLRIV